MPGPLLPVLGPLLPALFIYLGLRRWPIAAGISGFFSTLLLRFLLAAVPLETATAAAADRLFAGGQFQLFGRSLLLTEALQSTLLFIYTGAALLFLFSALWPQGPDFVPAGLAALAPISLALQVEPFTFGAVSLLVAGAFIVPMIQGGRAAATQAALRYLTFLALALPPLLVAGWMLESQQLILAGTVRRLLLLGLTLLLASFPFHIWIRPLLEEARPLVAVYVLAIVQLASFTFAWQLLQRYPSVQQSAEFSTLLAASGAASALLAALLALNASNPRQLLAYLLLADVGAAMLALSAGAVGIEATTTVLLTRFVSLSLACIGLLMLQPKPGDLYVDQASGLLSSRQVQPRWGRLLFVFGTLSLAGAPLTVGFSGRWAAVGLAAGHSLWFALPLLLATVSGVIGVARSADLPPQKAGKEPAASHPLPGT